MIPSLTLHAQERAREREISWSEICETMEYGHEIARDKISRQIRLGRICLVQSLKTQEIITVYREARTKKRLKNYRRWMKMKFIHSKHDRMR